ncbi:unnamed protein product [Cylicostephanus goldi]|uniref:Uncharacterized protein n=1 Tax=Cylicostephanus goldi TaxID=71465 RepID=A0A3P6RXB3_CYLGO|nr:unnamed protein product [Cylicostephanus goldi]
MTGLATTTLCKLPFGFGLTIAYVIYHYFAYVCLYSSTLVSVLRLIAVIEPVDAEKNECDKSKKENLKSKNNSIFSVFSQSYKEARQGTHGVLRRIENLLVIEVQRYRSLAFITIALSHIRRRRF